MASAIEEYGRLVIGALKADNRERGIHAFQQLASGPRVAREKAGKRIEPTGIQLIEGSLRIAVNPSSSHAIELRSRPSLFPNVSLRVFGKRDFL
jgi:hypothetical protein